MKFDDQKRRGPCQDPFANYQVFTPANGKPVAVFTQARRGRKPRRQVPLSKRRLFRNVIEHGSNYTVACRAIAALTRETLRRGQRPEDVVQACEQLVSCNDRRFRDMAAPVVNAVALQMAREVRG